MSPHISIIILNWNGWRDTIECLESVFQSSYTHYTTIIVDNCSSDDSIEKIKEYCAGKIHPGSIFFKYNPSNKPIPVNVFNGPDFRENVQKGEVFNPILEGWLTIIRNKKNFGFAEGNNIGIRFVREKYHPKYIFLLNNDTVIHPDCIRDLICIAEKDERFGIIGALPYRYAAPKEPESLFLLFNPRRGNFKPITIHGEDTEDVDYVSGCSLLIKDELISKIGFLYSPLFLYYEDCDWCLRSKKYGYRVIAKITPKVWHKGGASTDNLVTGSHLKMYFGTRNRIICTYRNVSSFDFLIFSTYFIILIFIKTHIDALRQRNLPILKPFYRGIIDAFRFILTVNRQNAIER